MSRTPLIIACTALCAAAPLPCPCSQAVAQEPEPLAAICSLDPEALAERRAWIDEVLGRAVLDTPQRDGDTVMLRVDAASRPEVEQIIEAEQSCCGGIEATWATTEDPEVLELTVHAQPAMLDLLLAHSP